MASGTATPPATTKLPTLSVREAAHVLGAPQSRLQRAIDRRTLRAELRRTGGRTLREISVKALLGYAVEYEASEYVVLTKTTRKLIQDLLATVPVEKAIARTDEQQSPGSAEPALSVPALSVGPFTLNVTYTVAEIIQSVRQVLDIRQMVVSDPHIRGGEPVVRGSRVPVYRLAELRAKGVPNKLLLEEHPSLTPESLDAALLYAELHPKSGRPPRPAPWHKVKGKVLLSAKAGPRVAEERTAPPPRPLRAR